ncbi:MAG: TonB-dependent receptor plug domain-containing protein [Caldimicrobium sp.]
MRYIKGKKIMGIFLVWLILNLYFCGELFAQNGTIFEIARVELNLIYGASLWAEPFIETPSPTMVYTKDFLKRFGFENLRDFLDYLPSFYLVQDVNERVISWRGLYTTSSNTFLFVENRHRLDLPAFGNFPLDASYPVKDINKIEVISGPSSSIYGSNALSGVIQVERVPEDAFSLRAHIGEYEEKGLSFSFKQRELYGLFHYNDIPGEKYKGISINPREDNYGLLFKSNFFEVPFQLFYFRNQYNTPFSQRGRPLRPEDKDPYGSKETIDYFSVSFNKGIDFKKFKLYFQPSFTHFKAKTPQVRTPHREGNFTALDIELENERASLFSYLEIPLRGGNFLLGFDLAEIYHKHYLAKLYNGSELRYLMPKEKEFNYAFFMQYKRAMGNLVFHLGARYDHFELWGERLSPRLALIYKINPMWTVQINYSEAFNAPALFYAKANPAIGYGSATNLKPEVLKNYSINLLYQENSTTLRITPYINELKDKIGYDSSRKVYTNLSKFKTEGLEIEGVYRAQNILAFLNFTYTVVRDGKNIPNIYKSEYIYGIPKTMLKGGISLEIPYIKGLSFAPSFKKISKTYWSNDEIPGYTIWDLNLLFERENLSFNFRVENLFDKHPMRAGTIPPQVWEGRQIKAGFEVKY